MRRWIWRSISLGLLLLCVGSWGWSYFYFHGISSDKEFPKFLVEANDGLVYVALVENGGKFRGLFFESYPVSTEHPFQSDVRKDPNMSYFFGFFVGHERYYPFSEAHIGTPLWFPAIVLALITLYVWRKTRPKPNPASAFPVDVKTSGTQ